MADINKLAKAVEGDIKAAAPTSSIPELSQLYAGSFGLGDKQFSQSAGTYNDEVTVANQKAAAEEARQRKIKMAEFMNNPNNYQQLPKKDGGYGFYDPQGKEISAFDYSRITGKAIDSILRDSQNPVDVGFNQDYKEMQNYMNAWTSGDKETVKSYQAQNQELANIKDPQDLINRFRQAYPTVFGQGGFQGKGTAGQAVGSQYFKPTYEEDLSTGTPGRIGPQQTY